MESKEKRDNYVLTGKKCLFLTANFHTRIIILKYLEFVSVTKVSHFYRLVNRWFPDYM